MVLFLTVFLKGIWELDTLSFIILLRIRIESNDHNQLCVIEMSHPAITSPDLNQLCVVEMGHPALTLS